MRTLEGQGTGVLSEPAPPLSSWLTCGSSLGLHPQPAARVARECGPLEVVMATTKRAGSARLFLQRQGSGKL